MKPPIFHRMFNYNRSLLPNAHLATLEEDVSTIEQAREKSGATIGYPGWGVIYHMLLSHLDRTRSEIIIETGTNWGCTTIVLAQTLIDAGCAGRVITFELESANAEKALANLHAAGVADRVENYTLYRFRIVRALGGYKNIVYYPKTDLSCIHAEFSSRQYDLSVTKIEHLSIIQLPSVIPAKAGIHAERVLFNWIPAFAGMTIGMNCYVLVFSNYQCSILVTLI